MGNFLRTNQIAMYFVTVIRIWLGYIWAMDGFHKLTGGFSAHGFIQGALKNPVQTPNGAAFPWFTAFLKVTTNNGHNTGIFSFLVAWGELLVGLGLIFGTLTTLALLGGLLMNVSFLFAGAISSNPIYIIIEFILLTAGFNAGKVGLDNWIIPWFRGFYQNVNPHEHKIKF